MVSVARHSALLAPLLAGHRCIAAALHTHKHMQNQAVVTAWEVSGKVDYNKLCDEFGCTPIPRSLVERIEKLTGVPAHPFLKRKVFYAHRDMEELLDLYEKGEKFYLYTGAEKQAATV